MLKRHVKFKHEGEAFSCSICGHKTYTLSHLRDHNRTIKWILCDFMGKTKRSLKIHMLRHDDPKFLCLDCTYKTYDRANFLVHRTVKHGNIAFKCRECDYETKSKRSLRQHKEKHHLKPVI